jgi:benzoate/toluate 1,2-dioxygenase reductase component
LTANNKPCSTGSKSKIQEAALINRHWLSKKAFEIELSRPADFQFAAGQTIRFLHGDIERYYSLISAPGDPTLALCLRLIEGGNFTPILANADIGTRYKLTGPCGYFIFNASPRPPVFVATGTGIAPFVSMARSGVRDFTLLHGVSFAEDLYYQDLFRETANNYVPCISGSVTGEGMLPGIFQGWVSEYIRNNLSRTEYDFYLCGRDEMVRDVTLLIDESFPGSRLFVEVFF